MYVFVRVCIVLNQSITHYFSNANSKSIVKMLAIIIPMTDGHLYAEGSLIKDLIAKKYIVAKLVIKYVLTYGKRLWCRELPYFVNLKVLKSKLLPGRKTKEISHVPVLFDMGNFLMVYSVHSSNSNISFSSLPVSGSLNIM